MSLEYSGGKLKLPCPSCSQPNGVDVAKLDKGPVCGSCGAKLDAPSTTIELSDATFKEFIESAAWPVLVDFWAPWCGPCRMMTPVLEELARQRAGSLLVAKLNTDESPQTPSGFGIRGIPTIILFRDGQEARRQVGAVPAQVLEQMLD